MRVLDVLHPLQHLLYVRRFALLALPPLLLTFLPEALRPLKTSYIMVYGAAVIAMIIFMPRGLAGLLSTALGRDDAAARPLTNPAQPVEAKSA